MKQKQMSTILFYRLIMTRMARLTPALDATTNGQIHSCLSITVGLYSAEYCIKRAECKVRKYAYDPRFEAEPDPGICIDRQQIDINQRLIAPDIVLYKNLDHLASPAQATRQPQARSQARIGVSKPYTLERRRRLRR